MSCLGASGIPTLTTVEMKIGPILKILKPGDIIEFPNVHGDGISHWGICISKNTMIHLDEDITEEDDEEEKFHDIVDLRSYSNDTKCRINNTEFDEYPDYEKSSPCSRRRVVKNAKQKASEEECHQDRWYGCESFVAWARFYPHVTQPSKNVTDFLSSKDLRYDVLESVQLDYFDTVIRRGAVTNNVNTNSTRQRKRRTPDLSEKQKAVETLQKKHKEPKGTLDQLYTPPAGEKEVKPNIVNQNHDDLVENGNVLNNNNMNTHKVSRAYKTVHSMQEPVIDVPPEFKPTLDYNPYMKNMEKTLAKKNMEISSTKKKSQQSLNFSIMDIETGPEQLTSLPASAVRANGLSSCASTSKERRALSEVGGLVTERETSNEANEAINEDSSKSRLAGTIKSEENKNEMNENKDDSSSIAVSDCNTEQLPVVKTVKHQECSKHELNTDISKKKHTREGKTSENNTTEEKNEELSKIKTKSSKIMKKKEEANSENNTREKVAVEKSEDIRNSEKKSSKKKQNKTDISKKEKQKSSKNSAIKQRLEAMLSYHIDSSNPKTESKDPTTRNKVFAEVKSFEKKLTVCSFPKELPVILLSSRTSDEDCPLPPSSEPLDNSKEPQRSPNDNAVAPPPPPPPPINGIPISTSLSSDQKPSTLAFVPLPSTVNELPVMAGEKQPPSPPPPPPVSSHDVPLPPLPPPAPGTSKVTVTPVKSQSPPLVPLPLSETLTVMSPVGGLSQPPVLPVPPPPPPVPGTLTVTSPVGLSQPLVPPVPPPPPPVPGTLTMTSPIEILSQPPVPSPPTAVSGTSTSPVVPSVRSQPKQQISSPQVNTSPQKTEKNPYLQPVN